MLAGREQVLLVVDRRHRTSFEQAFEGAGAGRRHKSCDRTPMPGDLYFFAGSSLVEEAQETGLGRRCGHFFCHMTIIMVISGRRGREWGGHSPARNPSVKFSPL